MVSPWVRLSRAVIERALYDLACNSWVHGESKESVQDDAAWFFANGEHEVWCHMAEYDAEVMLDVAREIVIRYNDRGLSNDTGSG